MFGLFKKNDKKEICKWGIAGGVAEIIYVIFVVLAINYLGEFLPEPNELLGFLFGLLLFVFSVAVSGVLVFGYPAYLALQKKYKPAFWTLLATLLTILIGFIVVLLIILLI